ncbi:MAG: zf-HC2 domain-containing protein [Chloroflexi bacterium]|nr:zf-HC2 domain-containing protein [Chloroflexota bacterium]MBP8058039.1 zf-HC2 domain-containing protein [Chloroflexota bacterium]
MDHITDLISDYLLDLLPAGEKVRVEQHAAACARCRQLLQAERHLVHLTRDTLMLVSTPAPTRLAHLMPPVPLRHRSWYTTASWQRSLALVGVFLFLLVASLSLGPAYGADWGGDPSPTHVVATATITPVPATVTHTLTIPVTSTEAPENQPFLVTPVTQATPIAFLFPNP